MNVNNDENSSTFTFGTLIDIGAVEDDGPFNSDIIIVRYKYFYYIQVDNFIDSWRRLLVLSSYL